eukprot:g12454.t1
MVALNRFSFHGKALNGKHGDIRAPAQPFPRAVRRSSYAQPCVEAVSSTAFLREVGREAVAEQRAVFSGSAFRISGPFIIDRRTRADSAIQLQLQRKLLHRGDHSRRVPQRNNDECRTDFLDGFLNGEDWGGARATSNAAPGATVAGVGTTRTAEIEAAKSRSVGRQETRFDAAAGSTTAAVEAARLAAIATADALAESVTKNESTSASASAIAASTDDITAMLGLEEILGRRVHQHNGNGEREEGQSKASATAAKKDGEISGAETVDSLMAWMLSDPSWLDDAARARSWSGRGVAGKGCFRPDLPIGGSASSRSSSLAAARGAAFLYAGKSVGCAPTGRLESNNDFNAQLRSRSCDSGSGGRWNSAQDMFFPAVNNIFNASGATSKGQGGEWCGGKYGRACSSHGTAMVMRRGGAKGSAFAPIGGAATNRTGRADPYSSCYATSAAAFDGKGNGGATTPSNSNSMFVGGSSIAGGTTCSGVRGHYGGGKGSQPAGKGSNYSSGLHPFDASSSQTSFGQSSHLYRGGAGAGAPPGLVPHSGGYSRRGKNYTTICRVDFVGRGDFEVPPELGPVPYVRRDAPPLVREQSEAGAYKDPADLPFAFDVDMRICAESSSKAGTSPAEGGGGNGRDRSGRAATEVSGPGDGSGAGGAAAEASAAPARAGGPTAGCTATDKDSDHDGGDTIPGRTVLTKERGGRVADAQQIQPAFGNGIQQPPAPALPRGLMRGNAARHCVPMQPAASRTFHPIERRARPVLPPPPGILPPPARNSAKNKSTGSSARGSPEDLRQHHVVGDPFADVAAIAFEDVNMGVSLTASLASSSSRPPPPQKRPLHPSPSLLLESPSLAAGGQKLQQAKKEVDEAAGAEGAPGRAAGSTSDRPLPPLPLLLTDTSDENRGDKKPKIKSTDDLDLAAVKGTTGGCAGNDDAERPQDDSSPQTTTDDQTPEDRAGKLQCEHEPKAQGACFLQIQLELGFIGGKLLMSFPTCCKKSSPTAFFVVLNQELDRD